MRRLSGDKHCETGVGGQPILRCLLSTAKIGFGSGLRWCDYTCAHVCATFRVHASDAYQIAAPFRIMSSAASPSRGQQRPKFPDKSMQECAVRVLWGESMVTRAEA